jgi:hypothetical protein
MVNTPRGYVFVNAETNVLREVLIYDEESKFRADALKMRRQPLDFGNTDSLGRG